MKDGWVCFLVPDLRVVSLGWDHCTSIPEAKHVLNLEVTVNGSKEINNESK